MFNNQIIAGSSGAQGGGAFFSKTLAQSLRFNDDDSAYLSRTPSSTSNQRTWTWSAWIKRGNINLGNRSTLFSGRTTGTSNLFGFFNPANNSAADTFGAYLSADGDDRFQTTRVFRDASAWYHFVVVLDTTQGSNDDRFKLYVNGVQETTWTRFDTITQNSQKGFNENVSHSLGAEGTSNFFDGYMAEVNFIDGQAYDPSYFGETKDGVWVPKAVSGVSYGTNGFHLTFADSSAIGDDLSGNTNDFTANNLVASDVVPDSPTKNFAVMNPLMIGDARVHSSAVYSEGNLKVAGGGFSTSTIGGGYSTIAIPKDKKIYIEVCETGIDGNYWAAGILIDNHVQNNTQVSGDGAISAYNRQVYVNGVETDYGSSAGLGGLGVARMVAGDVLGVAVDGATGKVWFHLNGTYFKSPSTNDSGTTGNPSAGTNEIGTVNNTDSNNPSGEIFFFINNHGSSTNCRVNFGQDSTFAGSKSAGSQTDSNGDGLFQYAVPTDYVCLHSGNMSDVTIGPGQTTQADDHFNTVLYTGNGGTNAITGVGFQPDWVWVKARNGTNNHEVYDSVRGTTKRLYPDLTSAEDTGSLTSFDSDGFTHTSGPTGGNASSTTYVGWNWKAGGTAVSNSDGSLTCNVSANTDAGFSIVTWTANSDNGTLGHGLNSAPEMIIAKPLGNGTNWYVMHTPGGVVPANNVLNLDSNAAAFNPGVNHFNDTYPTSTVFSYGGYLGDDLSNDDKVAYCFHSVEGYSKVSTYKGNGSSDGTFVYTGFRPAWVMIKRTNATENWRMQDSKRLGYNPEGKELYADLSLVEASNYFDIVSNGFKIRNTSAGYNASGSTYIYLAFATAPFKFANAR